MKSSKFGPPAICVGNLSMGGTGKTPHVEYLIRLLKNDYKLATLSRGFGRRERGFFIANDESDAMQIGDEPMQYYTKYGKEVVVAVEADRVLGAMDLYRQHEDIDVLLLDDAYQHRKIHAGMNILLTDYSAPFYSDFILPVGNLRESRSGKNRADLIVVTKCPDLEQKQKDAIEKRISPSEDQQVFFSQIKYGQCFGFGGEEIEIANRNLILVTGIAKAQPLVDHLSKTNQILHHFNYADHHKFKGVELDEIHKLFSKFADQNPLILTTEKDAMRLLIPELKPKLDMKSWAFQSIEVEVDRKEEFDKAIKQYVKENN